MPFGIGIPELVILLVLVLIIFGAGQLPKVAEGLGRGIRDFRASLKGLDEDGAAEREPVGEERKS
jgi:sec-independent protein translocase protein TatA